LKGSGRTLARIGIGVTVDDISVLQEVWVGGRPQI
jgi:hypothetical protein